MRNRNYGIDLLRIISMIQILMLHTLGHGGILSKLSPDATLYKFAWFFEIACYGAVNCFALISGYVGVKSNFKYKKIIPLWLQVSLYSGLITTAFYYLKPETVTKTQTMFSFLPVLNDTYWYFTAYFIVLLLMPILNNGINALTKKQAAATVIATLGAASISTIVLKIQSLSFLINKDIFALKSGYTPLWLIILYIVGGCISKHQLLKSIPSFLIILINLLSLILTIAFKLYSANNQAPIDTTAIINYCSPTVILGALTSLEIFSRLKFKKPINVIIGYLSSVSFAAYLMQDHPLVRKNIMSGRFVNLALLDSIHFVLQLFAIVLITYLIAIAVDSLRLLLFKGVKLK